METEWQGVEEMSISEIGRHCLEALLKGKQSSYSSDWFTQPLVEED